MKESTKVGALALAIVVSSCSLVGLGANSCRILTDAEGGTGGWSSSKRWQNGLIPQTGDDINIYGSVTANDDDIEILNRGAWCVLRNSNVVLTLNIANNHTITGHLAGSGTVEKRGVGALTLGDGYSQAYQMDGGFVVNEGSLYVGSCTVLLKAITVNAPGVFYLPSSGNYDVVGINGNGTISTVAGSTTAQQLNIKGDGKGTVYEFSGTISGNVALTMDGGNQHLLKKDNVNEQDFRFKNGTMGVASFGQKDVSSSFGKSRVWMSCPDRDTQPALMYCADEQETTTQWFVFTSNPLGNMTIDGGASGGVTFGGRFYCNGTAADSMMRMTLQGSNAKWPCVMAGEFFEPDNGAVYMTKTGSGTWRFPASATDAKYKGVFAVEAGTLECESLAEAGSWCSLGFATLLHLPYSGARDNSKAVPYAYLLGNAGTADDADLATFSYVGSSDVDVTTRPVALKGAARIRNATDKAFVLAGVTSAQSGRNDLVLDGAGTGNRLVNVTNGVGTVGLVKEGVGTWTLEGRVNVSGGVIVKGGTLNLAPSDPSRMTWFRFTIKKNHDDVATTALSHFGLFDAQHNDVSLGVTYNPNANGRVRTCLRPGQAAFETSDCSVGATDTISMNYLFRSYVRDYTARWSRNNKVPDPDNSETWPVLVIRLSADVTAPVVAYDMISGWYASGKPYSWTPTDWTVEGSVDGITWTPVPLDGKTGWMKSGSGDNYWLSDASPCSDVSTGFAVTTTTGEPAKTLALGKLAVAPSSTFAVSGGASVSEWDLASGAGTVKGIAFAATGTLKVAIPSTAGKTYAVSCDLQDCTGLANLKNWTLLVNGVSTTKWSLLRASECEFVFAKPGFAIVVR